MSDGYVVLVLHAHLPYVLSHGAWPHGSDWLCEAASETYMPLLGLLGRLSAEKRRARFTVGITPVLCEMLGSSLFAPVFKDYLREKIRAADVDRRTFEDRGQRELALLADGWRAFYASRLAEFSEVYGEDILAAYRRFQDEGQIELIVSAATHAYLPLLGLDSSINAQINQGVATYRKHFARAPAGMWLPECAYRPERHASGQGAGQPARPGIEAFLTANHLQYFFLDDSCALGEPEAEGAYEPGLGEGEGREVPEGHDRWPSGPATAGRQADLTRMPAVGGGDLDIYGIHRTGRPGSEIAFFVRDRKTSAQVWSARLGYPGDPYYLEFHKKRDPGGLRYWRVTDHGGDLGAKMVYEPDRAAERAAEHARHFARLVEARLRLYKEETGRTGVLTLPFDAELFGHWWFEGISWLGALVSAFDEKYVTIKKASTALKSIAPLGTVSLPEGSWGEGGRHLTWYNKETAWTWESLHEAERAMERALKEAADDEVSGRLLRQMARELFLLQSSDWQFLISTGTAGDYGASRFRGHYEACVELGRIHDRYRETGTLSDADSSTLQGLEERDALFDNVELEWFKERIGDGL